MKYLTLIFLFPVIAFADPVEFFFTDNSDNEDGFIVEVIADGEWSEVMRLPANVTEFEYDVTESNTGVRVWAYLIDSWGVEVRSSGSADLFRTTDQLFNPDSLQIKKQTVIEEITRTTVTEYKQST